MDITADISSVINFVLIFLKNPINGLLGNLKDKDNSQDHGNSNSQSFPSVVEAQFIIFQKAVVDERGRGGYCMEVSILFYHVLLGLGFNVYTAGVRIRLRENGIPYGPYTGWFGNHVILISSG